MPTREILETYTLSELRDEVRKTNLKRFSVMKKAELIEKMIEPQHRGKFHHLKGGTKRVRNTPSPTQKAPLTVTKADGHNQEVKELKMKEKKPKADRQRRASVGAIGNIKWPLRKSSSFPPRDRGKPVPDPKKKRRTTGQGDIVNTPEWTTPPSPPYVRIPAPAPPKKEKKRRKRKEPEEYKRNVSVDKSTRRLRSMLERGGRLLT